MSIRAHLAHAGTKHLLTFPFLMEETKKNDDVTEAEQKRWDAQHRAELQLLKARTLDRRKYPLALYRCDLLDEGDTGLVVECHELRAVNALAEQRGLVWPVGFTVEQVVTLPSELQERDDLIGILDRGRLDCLLVLLAQAWRPLIDGHHAPAENPEWSPDAIIEQLLS